MRTALFMLAFLIAGVANAGEPSGAVLENGSCKLATLASEGSIDFRVIDPAISKSKSTDDFCFWWKGIRYYTDATYTVQCGSRNYYCDGTVGTSGVCNPPSPYYIVQVNCDCE
jgi:hypothetical protein